MVFSDIITDKALDTVYSGVKKLHDAVSVTMGPRGRNVVIRKNGARTAVTHDGVTVARSIKLKDRAEDSAAEILREAASKMEAVTGDGTTTVTVLTHALLDNFRKSKMNPMELIPYLYLMEEEIVSKIKEEKLEPTRENVVNAATVASGSKEIGESIGNLLFNAGHKTPVVLGFSDMDDTIIEEIDGVKIASGPASPYLADPSGANTEIEAVKVAVIDAKLRDKTEIIPILSLLSGMQPEDRKLLLVVNDISGDALALCVMNKLKGFAEIAVARVPQGIHSASEYLSDIALATGATLLSTNTEASVKQPTMEHFGSASRVIVSPGETLIVGGECSEKDMKKRIESLEKIEATKSGPFKKFAQDRLATLNQKVISIMVGGKSGTEAEEKHYRYDDCIGATKAALRSGVVPGGGTLLAGIAESMGNSKVEKAVKKALWEPLRKVLFNAGITKIKERQFDVGIGVDVLAPNLGIVDLVERGIVDPMESEVECVRTAFGAAALLLSMGAMVIDGEENETK